MLQKGENGMKLVDIEEMQTVIDHYLIHHPLIDVSGEEIISIRLGKKLGEGGYAQVFKGLCGLKNGSEYQAAIKIQISKSLKKKKAVEKEIFFQRDVNVNTKNLIPQYYGHLFICKNDTKEKIYISVLIMELCRPIDELFKGLTGDKREEMVCRLGKDILEVICLLHGAFGRVDRDIKPDNILWKKNGDEIKFLLADFTTISNTILPGDERETNSEGVTWAYAPEYVRNNNHYYGEAWDCFSIAVTLYYLLFLKLPRKLRFDNHSELKIKDPNLKNVIRYGLSSKENERYFDAHQMKADLSGNGLTYDKRIDFNKKKMEDNPEKFGNGFVRKKHKTVKWLIPFVVIVCISIAVQGIYVYNQHRNKVDVKDTITTESSEDEAEEETNRTVTEDTQSENNTTGQYSLTIKDEVIDKNNIVEPTNKPSTKTDYKTVEFGSWFLDSTMETQKLKWYVIEEDENSFLLLSVDCIDAIQANDQTGVEITWEKSSIREFLNGEFYEKCFTAKEKEMIQETVVHSEGNVTYHTVGGENTVDRVYVLSSRESWDKVYGHLPEAEICQYALKKAGDPKAKTWLRDVGDSQYSFQFAYADGTVGTDGMYCYKTAYIRPVIRVSKKVMN